MFITRRRFMSITQHSLIGILTVLMLLAGSTAQAAEGATRRIMVYGDSNTCAIFPSKAA
jgi:hypothetical protein